MNDGQREGKERNERAKGLAAHMKDKVGYSSVIQRIKSCMLDELTDWMGTEWVLMYLFIFVNAKSAFTLRDDV